MSSTMFRLGRRTLFALLLTFSTIATVEGQSQESKPTHQPPPATPTTAADNSAAAPGQSGVSGASWEGPYAGVSFSWDPEIWTVEQELIKPGYDGLQIGTPDSTIFVEAYEGFAGDADACLAASEEEIRNREGVSEVVRLEGRPLPATGELQGPSRLFGVVAAMTDGGPYRGIEYIECRSLISGTSVLELTWQTSAAAFNQELPLAEALLAAVEMPGMDNAPGFPAAPPSIDPNTAWHHATSSFPESASAK